MKKMLVIESCRYCPYWYYLGCGSSDDYFCDHPDYKRPDGKGKWLDDLVIPPWCPLPDAKEEK